MQINKDDVNETSINTNQDDNSLDVVTQNEISTNDYIEVGKTESRGFILDNVFHSEEQGDIHFTSYYPNDYNKDNEYAIYFALPGWEGLYFQGLGANMGENYPYEAQKYIDDMIIISPQLDDWGEESANDTIALVEFFLNNYNIDKSRVYISGYSGGGETLSVVLGKRPELFTSALHISSVWDGDLEVLANEKIPLYIVIGEEDSYYGSDRIRNSYNRLYEIYKNKGLADEEIQKILVLDVKNQDYFESKGYSDRHAGGNSFATDSNIMNWIFSKSK